MLVEGVVVDAPSVGWFALWCWALGVDGIVRRCGKLVGRGESGWWSVVGGWWMWWCLKPKATRDARSLCVLVHMHPAPVLSKVERFHKPKLTKVHEIQTK